LFSSGELVRNLHGGHPIKSMGFSSDGRQLAVGSKSVELWDLNRYEKQ
jgi:WD40 repeat protein